MSRGAQVTGFKTPLMLPGARALGSELGSRDRTWSIIEELHRTARIIQQYRQSKRRSNRGSSKFLIFNGVRRDKADRYAVSIQVPNKLSWTLSDDGMVFNRKAIAEKLVRSAIDKGGNSSKNQIAAEIKSVVDITM